MRAPTSPKLPNGKSARPPKLDKVIVKYDDGGRTVTCFCGTETTRSIVPHLKSNHRKMWSNWTLRFIELRAQGYPLKRIMRTFRAGSDHLLFSWTVIERAIRTAVESGEAVYVPPRKAKIVRWQPEGFALETDTVWDFPQRGDWAVHTGDYRGNWPPEVPRNLIERYTQPGDLVVDAFVGGGTSLIEAWLLGRPSIGLDISRMALDTSRSKLKEMERAASKSGFQLDPALRPKIVKGDALRLSRVLARHGVQPGGVKLLCAHPPYLNSLAYTSDARDLSTLAEPDAFAAKIQAFAQQARQAVPDEGVCALLMGDVRRNGSTLPLGLQTMASFLSAGFALAHIVVKTQHKDRSSEFYVNGRGHDLLMAHEYLFILRSAMPSGRKRAFRSQRR